MEHNNIEDLFPYVEHHLKTMSNSILIASQFYSNRVFSSAKIEGLENLKYFKSNHPDSSFVYVSRHRSHIDYLETQLKLGKEGIPTRIQAGDNLFIGPLDPLLRHCGAFMVVRDEHGFYSKNWFLNSVYSCLPNNLGPYKKQYETYVNRKLSKILYEHYLRNILNNNESSKDLLVYPEYVRESDGSLKYGRSYSGALLDFSPYVFDLIQKTASNIDRAFFFVPVNVSYSQIIEDSFISQIPTLKKTNSKSLLYVKEFIYIATRAFSPFFKPGKFVLKFGEPSEIKKGYSTILSSSRSAKKLKDKVGLLETVFAPQIIFYSMDKKTKIPFPKLEDKVMANISKLDNSGVDTSNLKRFDRTKSFDDLLEEVLRLFDAPKRRFVYVKDNHLCVLNSDVVNQYANHIAHLF